MDRSACFREFSRYTILSIAGTLGVSCYILADTFFVSKGLGTSGLAALNLAIPVYNFIHGTGLMLGMGGATKFSVCKNHGQKENVDRIYTNTIMAAVLFSAAFMLPGIVCSRQLALLLGADPSILEMTDTYLRWLLLFSPAFILNDVLLCFVRNDEEPQLSMIAMLIGSFANIVLDHVFIFSLKMGIFGAIFATGLSPIISMAMMSPHWLRKKNTFHLVGTKPDTETIGSELSLGFPSLIAQVSSGIVMIVFNTIILDLEGNTGVAAYSIIANISLVVVAVYTGIAQGVQPLISRSYALGNKEQAQLMLRYALTTMMILSGVLYLLIVSFPETIIAVFNSEKNAELQAIAVTGLKLYFTASPFVGCNIILAVFFTSLEKARPAHILSVLRGFVLIVPLAFALSSLWGMTGVWITYPITEFLVALLGAVLYKKQAERKTNDEN